MKKTSFLKGLAMAAVAMVCAFTTSCSEEELKVNGTPQLTLPAASATLTVAVVDLEAGETLSVKTTDVTSAMGTDYSVECPTIAGYTTANAVTVNIPKVADGQAVNVPVTFYVVKLSSAYAEILASINWEDGEKVETIEEEIKALNDAEDFINETAYDKKETAEFNILTGKEFNAIVESKAANTIAGVLGEMMKFDTKKATVDLLIAPWCQAVVKVMQEININEYTAEYNGQTETFTVKEAGPAYFSAEYSVIPGKEHDFTHNNHGHGHGHGGSSNAGGGIIIAE